MKTTNIKPDDYNTADILYEYLNKNMKSTFKETMKTFLYESQSLYDTYFVTFTFCERNVSIKRDANKFFEKMIQRLNNKVMPNHKLYKRSAVLILFPEYDPCYSKLHFHGLMLIHKQTTRNFFFKCRRDAIPTFAIDAFEKKKKDEKNALDERCHTRLSDYIIKPFTKFVHQKNKRLNDHPAYTQPIKPCLTIADYRIYKTPSFDDTARAFDYAQKHFQDNSFDYADCLIYKRTKKNPDDKHFVIKRKKLAGQIFRF